jgi:hypothetical protein
LKPFFNGKICQSCYGETAPAPLEDPSGRRAPKHTTLDVKSCPTVIPVTRISRHTIATAHRLPGVAQISKFIIGHCSENLSTDKNTLR